jgi:hypothetical protein
LNGLALKMIILIICSGEEEDWIMTGFKKDGKQ